MSSIAGTWRRRRISEGKGADNAFETINMSMEDNIPSEETEVKEDLLISDPDLKPDEFNEHVSAAEDEEEQHRTFRRKNILQPIAATLIGVTAIFASFGADPLGFDIFGESGQYFSEHAKHAAEEEKYRERSKWSSYFGDEWYEEPWSDPWTDPGSDPGQDTQDGFPVLSNLEPDFEGKYAWADYGSEEYIRYQLLGNNEYNYVVRGGAWEGDGKMSDNDSISYDRETNVLTLTNFVGVVLDTNLMGNGFTVRLVGENRIGRIIIWGAMYGGSVKFTGSGSLTVDLEYFAFYDQDTGEKNYPYQPGPGILLNAEESESCLMADSGVNIEVYSSEDTAPALAVSGTKLSRSVYWKDDVDFDGTLAVSEEEGDLYNCWTVTSSGELDLHVSFKP